jgi:threonine dehydrogenase-like Zn-dependent dehydrogenase
MRASITLTGPCRLGYSLDPVLPLPRDAWRIAPRFAGVCGTDLDIIRRTRGDMPSVLGHEVVAEVTKSDIHDVDGRIVVVNPVSDNDQRRNFGHSIPGVWTTQRVIMPREIADGHLAYWPSLDVGPESALAEPVGVAVYARALMQLNPRAPAQVLILGSGGTALTLAIVLTKDGHAVTLSPSCPEHAAQLDRALESPIGLRIVPRTDLGRSALRADAAAVMVSRGSCRAAVSQALGVLKPGGILDLVSSVDPGSGPACNRLSFDKLAEIRWHNTRGNPVAGAYLDGEGPNGSYRVTGQRGTSAGHIAAAMELIDANYAAFRKILSHVVPFEEAAAFIEAVARNRAARIDGRIVTKAVIAF